MEATEKVSTTGIGLGVSICKQIIEGLGGQLNLVEGCDSIHCLQNLVFSDSTTSGTTFSFSVKLNDYDFNQEEHRILEFLNKRLILRASQKRDRGISLISSKSQYEFDPECLLSTVPLSSKL